MSKGRTHRQITSALPELEDNQEVRDSADLLDELQALSAMSKTEGAEILVKKYSDMLVSDVHKLISVSEREHTHVELLAIIMSIKARFELIADIKNAENNAEIQQDVVDEIIKSSL